MAFHVYIASGAGSGEFVGAVSLPVDGELARRANPLHALHHPVHERPNGHAEQRLPGVQRGGRELARIPILTNALGQVTHFTSYNASGYPLSVTDPSGVVTTYTYDVGDRLLTQTNQAASGNATTSMSYDGVGDLTKITLPNGSFLAYTCDAAQQLIQVADNQGNRMSYTLDAYSDITVPSWG